MSDEPKCKACGDSGISKGSGSLDCAAPGCGAAQERSEVDDFFREEVSAWDISDAYWAVYQRGKAAGAAEAVPAWQPIATAPKDGARILLYSVDGIIEGFWSGTRWDQSIVYADFGADTEICSDPTHWVPLPAAQKVTK